MTIRNNNIENPQQSAKLINTVFTPGMWVSYNGAGYVKPLDPTESVLGLNGDDISTTSNLYATTEPIHFDQPLPTDRWNMSVSVGTALASMVGSSFDVAAADSSSLDVSGAGTQFTITKVYSTTQVEVMVNFPSAAPAE